MSTSDQELNRLKANMEAKSNELQSGANEAFKGKIIWPHDGKMAVAEGILEVCSLVVLVIVTSRFGLTALAVFAFYVGTIDELTLTELLAWFAR